MSQMRAGLVGIEAGTEQVVLQMTAEGGDKHIQITHHYIYRHIDSRSLPLASPSRYTYWLCAGCHAFTLTHTVY